MSGPDLGAPPVRWAELAAALDKAGPGNEVLVVSGLARQFPAMEAADTELAELGRQHRAASAASSDFFGDGTMQAAARAWSRYAARAAVVIRDQAARQARS